MKKKKRHLTWSPWPRLVLQFSARFSVFFLPFFLSSFLVCLLSPLPISLLPLLTSSTISFSSNLSLSLFLEFLAGIRKNYQSLLESLYSVRILLLLLLLLLLILLLLLYYYYHFFFYFLIILNFIHFYFSNFCLVLFDFNSHLVIDNQSSSLSWLVGNPNLI